MKDLFAVAAPLAAAARPLVAYALKFTREPEGMRREDVEALRVAEGMGVQADTPN